MLKVIKAGFYTTVQDLGRFGYRDKGVPVSGVMDVHSCRRTNVILGNAPNCSVLEITMTGPVLEFTADTYIAFGGANFNISLNGKSVTNYKAYKIIKGDVVTYNSLIDGFRGYLAIKNGFKSDEVLGSQSYYKPITAIGNLKDNSSLAYDKITNFDNLDVEYKSLNIIKNNTIKVFKGPEYEILNDSHLGQIFFKNFSVAKENNRMAFQLKETIASHNSSILTSATLPGTVQLTPAGKLIILMKDGQTTGGYPRILQLSEESIAILAQKRTADKLRFKLINH